MSLLVFSACNQPSVDHQTAASWPLFDGTITECALPFTVDDAARLFPGARFEKGFGGPSDFETPILSVIDPETEETLFTLLPSWSEQDGRYAYTSVIETTNSKIAGPDGETIGTSMLKGFKGNMEECVPSADPKRNSIICLNALSEPVHRRWEYKLSTPDMDGQSADTRDATLVSMSVFLPRPDVYGVDTSDC